MKLAFCEICGRFGLCFAGRVCEGCIPVWDKIQVTKFMQQNPLQTNGVLRQQNDILHSSHKKEAIK